MHDKHIDQMLENGRIEIIENNIKLLKKNVLVFRKENIKSNIKLLRKKLSFNIIYL